MNNAIKLLIFLTLCISTLAQAAEHNVKMFSWNNGKAMVFEPAILHANVGDTVKFMPMQPGHQVTSVSIPKGAEEFSSEIDSEFILSLNKEGIYFYSCTPHILMNMSGLIQVGNNTDNRPAVEQAIKQQEEMAIMNQGRAIEYLQQLDEQNSAKPEQKEQKERKTSDNVDSVQKKARENTTENSSEDK